MDRPRRILVDEKELLKKTESTSTKLMNFMMAVVNKKVNMESKEEVIVYEEGGRIKAKDIKS
jgi:hypothetical protein